MSCFGPRVLVGLRRLCSPPGPRTLRQTFRVPWARLSTIGPNEPPPQLAQESTVTSPKAEAQSVLPPKNRFVPTILNDRMVAQALAARRIQWARDALLHSLAYALYIDPSEIGTVVQKFPSLVLLNESNFVRLYAMSQQEATERFLTAAEKNLRMVSRFGIDVTRVRLAEWVWLLDTKPLSKRLEIADACPEVLAVLCSYSDRLYSNVWPRLNGPLLNDRFRELFVVFGQYIGLADSYELVHHCQRHTFLLWLPLDRIRQLMQMMLENGVSPDQIRNDLWVLKHNVELGARRLAQARAAGLPVVKPWLMRCPELTFKRHLDLLAERKAAITPHHDITHYLAELFECSVAEIQRMEARHPLVFRARYPKLVAAVKYLLGEGYQPKEILKSPRVLLRNLNRTKARIDHYAGTVGGRPKLLSLCYTDRAYEEFCNKSKPSPMLKCQG